MDYKKIKEQIKNSILPEVMKNNALKEIERMEKSKPKKKAELKDKSKSSSIFSDEEKAILRDEDYISRGNKIRGDFRDIAFPNEEVVIESEIPITDENEIPVIDNEDEGLFSEGKSEEAFSNEEVIGEKNGEKKSGWINNLKW